MTIIKRNFGKIRVARARVMAALLAYALAQSASALEVTAGDYEVLPGGTNLGLLYVQHAERTDAYANGTRVANNAGLKSDIGIARFIHVVKLSETSTLDPQIIVPFGSLRTSGALAPLGNASGVADIVLGAPVKFLLDPTTRDSFSIGPFLYLPTGSYDSNKALNLGENRWKATLQLAYIKHFNPQWAIDLVGDVTIHGKNTDFTAAHATLKQDAKYELQAHLRYNLSQATALSVGLGSIHGGETEVNNVRQNDRINTQYARMTVTHFLNQTTQLQAQYGQDLRVENGLKEKARLNLRLVKLF